MTIAEDFALLVTQKDGEPVGTLMRAETALSGAVLMELAQQGRIGDDSDVVVLDRSPIGAPVEDAALARIGDEPGHNLTEWVALLRGNLFETFRAQLVSKGVIEERSHKKLGLIPATEYDVVDPHPREEIRKRLAAAVTGGSPDQTDLALLSLVDASNLDATLFPDIDPDAIRRLVSGEGMSKAVAEVNRRVIAAVVTAVTAAAAAT